MRYHPIFESMARRGRGVRSTTILVLALSLIMTAPTLVRAGDWDNANWDSEVVDSFGGLSANTGLSVAVDSQGRPHVAYYALKGADLRYAIRMGPSWETETVDDYQVVGPDCSIALDAEDLRSLRTLRPRRRHAGTERVLRAERFLPES